ncbi:GH39 family glycosyl hydrolase [Enterococcus sp. AZ196]|uniref:GH39 family glycosyl hydrolase n=1 Tax=Enterococcus sp. AZ196 TaxID=2774659 RepID=UPI003D299642
MSEIISYLDTQSDIRLMTDVALLPSETRTTDLLFLLKGKAELQIDEHCYEMKADDIVVVNKQERYQITANGKESLLFHFSISDFLLSQALETGRSSFDCNSVKDPGKNYQSIRKLIIEIIDLFLFENDKTNFLQISKVYRLLNELSSLFIEYSASGMDQDKRIQQITRIIKERYYDNLTLAELADIVHMDTAYFSKFFKKNLGLNFKDYLSQIRMQYAIRDLLESDKSITRIAIDNGFFSVNGFNKKFKEEYHVTPSEYRKQNGRQKQTTVLQADDKVKDSYNRYKEDQLVEDVSKRSSLHLDIANLTAEPIKETWSKLLNIGEAEIVLSSNLRQHLSILKQNLSFEYGRIWGVFTTELLGESLQEYERLDEILDSLIALGLTPWISINKLIHSFKESAYPIESWREALASFCRHVLNRYGRKEVGQWVIEIVASDPEDKELVARYSEFYRTTSELCRSLIPTITIGGGSFILSSKLDINRFLQEELSECAFDFYSFVLFPYSNRLIREKRNYQRITDPDFLLNQMQIIKQAQLMKPVYITEWSNTVSRSNLLNDSLYKGAFISKSIIDIFDQVEGLGYWLGTDLAQKTAKPSSLLSGGNGLINRRGLFKPAMHAMKLFDQLKGLKFLYKDEGRLVCTLDGEEFFVLGHHYVHPNSLYFLKDEAHLKKTELENFFEAEAVEEEIVFSTIPNGKYELRIFSCLKNHGDLFGLWEGFNFNEHLRSSDLIYLDEKNTHLQTLEEVEVLQNRLVVKKRLMANEFYSINIKRRQ